MVSRRNLTGVSLSSSEFLPNNMKIVDSSVRKTVSLRTVVLMALGTQTCLQLTEAEPERTVWQPLHCVRHHLIWKSRPCARQVSHAIMALFTCSLVLVFARVTLAQQMDSLLMVQCISIMSARCSIWAWRSHVLVSAYPFHYICPKSPSRALISLVANSAAEKERTG